MKLQIFGRGSKMTSKRLLQDKEEQAEVISWMNHQLCSAGYSEQVVTDMGVDIADGITLIKLVQRITGRSILQYHSNPVMRVQKLENVNICLRLLQAHGYSIIGVHAEDIVAGNLKTILSLCHSLMCHFKKQSLSFNGQYTSRVKRSPSSLGHDSRELLNWVAQVVHQNIPDYTSFYDGNVLCDLVNSVHNKAIDYNDLANLSPIQCLQVAFSAAEIHLGISRGTIDLHKLACGLEDHKLKSYLQHFRMIYQHKAKRNLRNSLLGAEQEPTLESLYSSNTNTGDNRTTHRVSEMARPKRSTSVVYLAQTKDHGITEKSTVRHSLSTEHLNATLLAGPPQTRTKQRVDTTNGSRHDLYNSRIIQSSLYPSRAAPPSTSTTLPRHSTTTVERSYSSDIPLPVTIYRTSSRSSIHSTSSRSSMDRSVDLPLTHLANLGSTVLPSHLLPVDTESDVHSEASGSTMFEQIFHIVADLNDRLIELSQSIDEEKNELEHKLLLAVKKERKQRELLEKRHEKLSKRANYVTQHYDGCLVDLAKEMAHIKELVQNLQEQVSSILPTRKEWTALTNELNILRQQVQQVGDGPQSQQQPISLDSHSSQATATSKPIPLVTDKSKKNLFSRKKS